MSERHNARDEHRCYLCDEGSREDVRRICDRLQSLGMPVEALAPIRELVEETETDG